MFHTPWVQFIRLSFWALYNPLAWTYDWVSQVVSLGHWHDWQREALSELRGKQVLELAFGTGNVLLDLHTAGYQPIGIDLSSTMVRITQRKIRRNGISLPLVRGYAQRLPFADASFDSVLCTFPADFITNPDTLSEIARVLCAGGRIVIVAMGKLTSSTPWSRFLEWLYRITGQRGSLPDLDSRLAAVGLEYRTVWKSVADSAVLLVIVEKQIDG